MDAFSKVELCSDDFSNDPGIFTVFTPSATYHNCLWAKPHGRFHGHGGMHSKFPCFITTGCNHAAFIMSAHNQGFAFQRRIIEAFNGNKKCIQIEVSNISLWRDIPQCTQEGRRRTETGRRTKRMDDTPHSGNILNLGIVNRESTIENRQS